MSNFWTEERENKSKNTRPPLYHCVSTSWKWRRSPDKMAKKRLRKRSSMSTVRGSAARKAVILEDNVRVTGSTEVRRKSKDRNSLDETGICKLAGRNIEQREFIAANSSQRADTRADTSPQFISGQASWRRYTTSVTANKQWRKHLVFCGPRIIWARSPPNPLIRSGRASRPSTVSHSLVRKSTKDVVSSELNSDKTSGRMRPRIRKWIGNRLKEQTDT